MSYYRHEEFTEVFYGKFFRPFPKIKPTVIGKVEDVMAAETSFTRYLGVRYRLVRENGRLSRRVYVTGIHDLIYHQLNELEVMVVETLIEEAQKARRSSRFLTLMSRFMGRKKTESE